MTDSARVAHKPRLPWDTIAIVALVVGIALTTFDFLYAFFVTPMVKAQTTLDAPVAIGGVAGNNLLLFSQKIFYFHVPVAIASMVFIIATAVYAILYLVKKDARYDTRTRVCMEVTLVFVIATMITGVPWTRFEWGVWWVWEPRLTTYFILMLLVFAYFILRAAIDDPERRARFSCVFAIIAAADAPISYAITRLIPSSLHPVLDSQGGMEPSMLLPFLCGIFGMSLVAFGLFRLRLNLDDQGQEMDELKERYERLAR